MNFGYPPNNYYQPTYVPQNLSNQQPAMPSLNGKVVESRDIVSATEVPFNSYGIFPQADLSRVYIKQWMNNGTTKISEYCLVEDKENPSIEQTLNEIQESILSLTDKVDKIKTTRSTTKKKEVVDDDEPKSTVH